MSPSRRLCQTAALILVVLAIVAGPVRADAAVKTYAELAESDDLADYLERVADDVDDLWREAFADDGNEYDSPRTFVVVEQATESACGAMEPGFANAYFCPLDEGIYLDPVLMADLAATYGAIGPAVIVAHEWGHHVQHQLGRGRGSITTSLTEPTSLQTELQADCLAGVWAGAAEDEGRLAAGDIDAAVLMMVEQLGDGDDLAGPIHDDPQYLDHQHGDGALRAWWFLQGYHDGADACGL